jgi:hypothetical protein
LRKNQALAKNPLFLVTYIYFLHFFFTLIKEKKWESGQKARKALCINGFSLPTFQIKPGKNPLFLARTVSTSLSTHPNISSF